MLKEFLGGAGAVLPLAKVVVGVTIPTTAHQKRPGSEPVTWLKHQSYGWLLYVTIRGIHVTIQQYVAIAVTVLGCLFSLIFHLGTKEVEHCELIAESQSSGSLNREQTESSNNDHNEHLNLKQTHMRWSDWFNVFDFYLIAILYMTTRIFGNVAQAYLPLYVLETQHFEKTYIAIIPMVVYLSSFVTSSILSFQAVSRYIPRKVILLFGVFLGVGSCVWMWFHELHTMVYAVSVLLGMASTILLVVSLALIADLISENTLTMHINHQGCSDDFADEKNGDGCCLDRSSSDEGFSVEESLSNYTFTDITKQFIEAAKKDRLLKTFCLSILKLVSLCHDIAIRASVFEEEDFQQSLDNFELASELSINRLIGMLKEADEDCQKSIRSSRCKVDEDSQKKMKDFEQIMYRFRYIRNFLLALINMTAKEEKDINSLPGSLPKKQNFEEACKCLQLCDELLEKIKVVNFDQKCLRSLKNEHFIFQHINAFDLGVNQHLMPPTLPRFVNFLLPSKAFEYFSHLVGRLMRISSNMEKLTSYATALNFFRAFSRSENCILSRSVLQISFLPSNYVIFNKTPLVDLIKHSICHFVNPSSLNPSFSGLELEGCKAILDEFFCNCSKIFAELLRISGHNRSRQRDCYTRLMEEFGTFQDEADRLDSLLHNVLIKQYESINACSTCPTVPVSYQHVSRFASFIIYHVLKCMLEYLLLGFELELYSTHEYAFIFWYLNEILFKWIINVLSKVDCILYAQDQAQSTSARQKTDKKKHKSKKKASTKTWHQLEILQTQSYQKMCDGYFKAMLGFYATDRIMVPIFSDSQHYDTIRCEHRLAPFFNLSNPPLISYQQFLDISNFKQIARCAPTSKLFAESAQTFDEARLCLETVPLADEVETATLIKVCKMNCVVLKLLATGTQDSHAEWPKFDFNLHSIFPVIKLK
uniref:Protein MAK10 homolog n=1 Tax=Romanomermis culicivorax TaxID=13658 RepID=A0A915IJZ5_ROMCU